MPLLTSLPTGASPASNSATSPPQARSILTEDRPAYLFRQPNRCRSFRRKKSALGIIGQPRNTSPQKRPYSFRQMNHSTYKETTSLT
ncbi:predicted protein [Plenodomus lingam JN3]|uniref:Predicted protein n=1 Tax=Leptosphaeria maculans (strain JN3 / isolate v23.1.3 / race Av1-4-5-6-7-8) TaxID=985895 RepID=E4ZNL4_LEPMJ|nr:predicted protein [Plenodomus lingam JN3]CBX93073.1 predicted protein [Plenodomus lingam JN3]